MASKFGFKDISDIVHVKISYCPAFPADKMIMPYSLIVTVRSIFHDDLADISPLAEVIEIVINRCKHYPAVF